FFGMVGVVYAVLLAFLLKDQFADIEKSPDKKQEPVVLTKAITALLGNYYFWLILLMFAVPSIPGWAAKNWLPTLFGTNLKVDMAQAGPIATITIAASSLAGVLMGGLFSDKWVQKNIRGRILVSSIGLGLMIPSLLLLGWGSHAWQVIGAGLLFGFGYGMFDANNMPILCQFVEEKYRATAYGIMNMAGVFSGALITSILGKSKDAGNLGRDFGMLAVIVMIALLVQVKYLKPFQTA
ncbi:MAG TPA: MFS transporter, partial [Sediminibacterium sp.]|nr:MFS transporter [Sediminibacterium sp.]